MEKKVSVIIRTHSRPAVLREALQSIKGQTYSNIETVVVEDGKASAKEMIEQEFADMNIVYKATGEHVGRCAVANIGLATASGEYVCFLDDDDLFYENHIEVLSKALDKSLCRAVYAIAEESSIKVKSYEPYIYKEVKRHVEFAQPFCKILLYHKNFMPIQTVLFEHSLYEELGGMDEKLEVLEDWDMWVRYSTVTDYEYVPEITSLYRVPAGKRKKSRAEDLDKAYAAVVEKFKTYPLTTDANHISRDVTYLLANYNIGLLRTCYRKLKAFWRKCRS